MKFVVSRPTALIMITLFLLQTPALANHQMSFSTDKTYYIQGKENVVLTLQDADNDGAFVGWDGIAVYDANGAEIANYDDNAAGQGHPVQAGKNLVWSWGQKYDVRAGAQNANNNGQLVPLGTYYGSAKTDALNQPGNQKNYKTQNFVIDTDNNNNGVPDSLDDDDNDGTKNVFDNCRGIPGPAITYGCPPGAQVPWLEVKYKENKERKVEVVGGYSAAVAVAAIIGTAAAGVKALPLTSYAEAALTTAVGAGAYFASDPPDLENFNKLYLLEDRTFDLINPENELRASEQRFSISAVKFSDALVALTKSMERYEGAKQKNDKSAMALQAGFVAKYAKLSEERLAEFKANLDTHIKLSKDQNADITLNKDNFILLQNKVRSEGLPKDEIDFARNTLKFSDAEIKNLEKFVLEFDVNSVQGNVSAINSMQKISNETEKVSSLLGELTNISQPQEQNINLQAITLLVFVAGIAALLFYLRRVRKWRM